MIHNNWWNRGESNPIRMTASHECSRYHYDPNELCGAGVHESILTIHRVPECLRCNSSVSRPFGQVGGGVSFLNTLCLSPSPYVRHPHCQEVGCYMVDLWRIELHSTGCKPVVIPIILQAH